MKSLNRVIKILILSDVAILTGLGFATPIFAIFLTQNIKGGNVEVAGFAAAIFWIVEAIAMIPIGRYIDKRRGEYDDLFFIGFGNFLVALSVFGYLFSFLPWHIYVLQAVYALGMAMNLPGYTAIFTRHIDKGHEALDWSVRAAFVGLGSGIAGALGGIIVQNFGFKILFVGMEFFIIFSALIMLVIKKNMKSAGFKK